MVRTIVKRLVEAALVFLLLFCISTRRFVFRAQENVPTEAVLEMILVRSHSEADKILERLKAGQAFEKLAKEFSIDPSAMDGGQLGKVRVAGLLPQRSEEHTSELQSHVN